MQLTITSLELNSPFKLFKVYQYSYHIMMQLKKSPCVAVKTTGILTKHYTMTLWRSEQEKIDFYRSGAHLKAMKKAQKIAQEISTLSLEQEEFLSWKEAKALLEKQGKKYILQSKQ
ncbi:MAG: DUF3291 domain-containing protein [Eudoraea sp.]|uniref:DUF3291 domain-containing protein n=1 Tax=Eudoraea sp. TaxID=1979955 RepID=UPI003C759E41